MSQVVMVEVMEGLEGLNILLPMASSWWWSLAVCSAVTIIQGLQFISAWASSHGCLSFLLIWYLGFKKKKNAF